ncbi:MAG: PGF-pre-PGF domain-containing protein, partial [Candidatus Aenigmarchaeota archaeon]|nr:PGF-pre-PGF domain-containing protein [Candidatus Aenigmarchaeota archaeon]
TLAIIGLLIISGPISAVLVNVGTDKTTYTASDNSVVFTVDVDVEADERIPVKNLTLTISGPTNKNCVFNTTGDKLTTCQNLDITVVNTMGYNSGNPMFGYGYGYGSDQIYNTTNQTFGSGDGFGYASGYDYTQLAGELRYQVTWNITADSPSDGNYAANLQAFAEANGNWRVYMDQSPTTFTINTDTFSFSGYTYDVSKNPLNNTNVTVGVYTIGQQGLSLVNSYSVLSNGTGFFNITNLPSVNSYMFKPVVIKYNVSNPVAADYVGQSLPDFPYREFGSLGSVNFYLKEAATVNVTTFNETGDLVPFMYMIKDTKLGYPIKEKFDGHVQQVTAHLPADRNYSIQLFPQMSMPVNYLLNNVSDYGNMPQIDVEFNLTEGFIWVSGYANYNNGDTFDDLRIVPYLLESDEMVFEQHPMPYNMSAWRWPQKSDSYDPSIGFYNMTLIGSAMGADIMLFATARNGSSYYGAFESLTLNAESSDRELNFTLHPLVGSEANITLDGPMGDRVNVTTLKKSFKLQNSTGSTPNSAHVEFQVDYSSLDSAAFTFMADVQSTSNGIFSLPILNTSVDEVNIYSPNFAPLKTSLTQSNLQSSPTIINMTAFNPGGIDEVMSDLKIGMYTSNTTCDVPSPPSGCSLIPQDKNLDEFHPLTVVMGGGDISFRMRKNSNNITVHYVKVDMLASGPPDVAFDSSANSSESGNSVEEAWRFGSQGPEIYDYVLLGMPYNESNYDERGSFNIRIELLYDDNWNAIWNISQNTTAQIPSSYSDYLNEPYRGYVDSSVSAVSCSKTVSTSTCYVNTDDNMIWMKIPHFSGVGPTVNGVKVYTAPETPSGDGAGGAGAGSTSTPYALKLWLAIYPETPVNWEIGKDNIALTDIYLAVKNQLKTVRLTVESLSDLPFSVEKIQKGLYQYLNVTAENVAVDDLDSVKIKFKIEKSWFEENNLDPDTVLLNRYSGSVWTGLETSMTGEDDTYYYYEASTPGFSYFAITANESGEAPVCGNGICEEGEDYNSCSSDCHKPAETPVCGNKVCETGEDCSSCLSDCSCAEGYVCVDGICKSSSIKKKSPKKSIVILLLIISTIGVIVWLINSLKEEHKVRGKKFKELESKETPKKKSGKKKKSDK